MSAVIHQQTIALSNRIILILLPILLASNVYGAPVCTDPWSDGNGNGWGWQDGESCEVVNGYENYCRVSNQNYPFCVWEKWGWGYEFGRSCISNNKCADELGYVVRPPTSSSSVSSTSSTSSSSSSTSSSGIADAGEALTLAGSPLESGLAPPPNVLIVTDDSGSMDWDLVIGQDADEKLDSLEVINQNGGQYRYGYLFGFEAGGAFDYDNYHGTTDQYSGRVAPPHSAVSGLSTSTYSKSLRDQFAGLWRVRSHAYNLIYYNPNVRYDPWPGYDKADPRNAMVDPSELYENPSATMKTVDLTTNATSLSVENLTVHIPKTTDYAATQNIKFYLPMYYKWAPSSASDTTVDEDECGMWVEIKADAKEQDCDGNEINGGQNIFPMVKAPARTDCVGSTCSAAEELQNFANWFTFYRRREFVAKAALSTVVSSLRNIRLGYASTNSDRYSAADAPLLPISDNNSVSSLLGTIYKAHASPGGTPLLRALDKSGRYFACQNNHIFGNSSCPADTTTGFEACQQNYTIMMTDGYWRADSADWDSTGVKTTNPAMADNDSSNSPFAGGAFADDNRTAPHYDDWLTLADIAMYYFMTDIDTNSDNLVVPTNIELDRMVDPSYWDTHATMHQHMNTFTIGFGVFNEDNSVGTVEDGNWIPPLANDTTVTWPKFDRAAAESIKVEDLKHAAFNGRGLFYDGNDAQALSENLVEIFDSIRKGAGAVGAVSFNSQRLSSDTRVFTASYNSRYNSGDVIAYNIDPDTGIISTAAENIVWSAAEELAKRSVNDCQNGQSDRTILSYLRDGANSAGFSLANGTPYLSNQQVEWIYGYTKDEVTSACDSTHNFRSRPNSKGILGDVVHSRPLYIEKSSPFDLSKDAYPSGSNDYDTFKSKIANMARKPMVVVGANDGLLHIFSGKTGEEIAAYAPQRLIQGLNGNNKISDLTDPNYTHQFFVDLSTVAQDVFIKTRSDSVRNWRTIAIGGYRAGGRGYFALDLTDPDDFSKTDLGVNNVLWEFSDLDDERLGNTFSPPLVVMTNQAHSNASEGHKWNAIFGNGYNSKDGVARLFVLDLEGGADGIWQNTDYKVVDVGSTPGTNESKNGLSTPRGIDTNGDGAVDYVYAGDLKGDVYRFDLTASNGSISVDKIFSARDAGGKAQPITTQPLIMRHPEDANAVVVVITTGSWMTREDAESHDIQSIYGFVDHPANTPSGVTTRSDLLVRYIKNITVNTLVERVIKGEPLNWSSHSGWYFDFAARAADIDPITDSSYSSLPVIHPGERAIRNMASRGGYVFVNTVYPNQQSSCNSAMGGSIMAFNPLTGLVDKPIIDFNQDGSFDSHNGENIAGRTTDKNLSDSAIIGDHLVIQQTDEDGTVTPSSFKTNTAPDVRVGRLSWKQIK